VRVRRPSVPGSPRARRASTAAESRANPLVDQTGAPENIKVAGLDLAGSEKRTSGYCLMQPPWHVALWPLHSDAEILARLEGDRPSVVSIDAPLALPRGRASLDIAGPPHLRACDRELMRRGIRFFPVTLGPMRMLTARGIRLKIEMARYGSPVIESYPGGAQDVLGFPRKQYGEEALRRALIRFGVTGDIRRTDLSHDELDSVCCAIVGLQFLRGEAVALGDPTEALLYLPSVPPGGRGGPSSAAGGRVGGRRLARQTGATSGGGSRATVSRSRGPRPRPTTPPLSRGKG